jgi:hypothetical protein
LRAAEGTQLARRRDSCLNGVGPCSRPRARHCYARIVIHGGPIDRLRDSVARQDEYSHVDAAVRQRIPEVVLEVENEPLEETARRIVERLSADELAQLVADWLEARKAI